MQLTLPVGDVLCLYGLPDHELYSELTGWLDEESGRFLVILEDDERALASQETKHEQIRLCFCENEEALKKIAWELVFLQFGYFDKPGNSTKTREKMEAFFAKMSYLQEGIHLVASDYQERGLDLLQNYFANQEKMQGAKAASGLFGKFAGTPAIICGAGASLEAQAEFLHEMEDKALLFAGGTTVACLAKLGIEPHLTGFIDPHLPSRKVEEVKNPTFFQSRVHRDRLSKVSGPLLWTPGSGNDLFEDGTFDGGWNVSTYLAALAFEMGCSPIILVGVDLTQKKETPYAAGVKRPEGGELIPLPEEGLFTRQDWLFAGEFLSQYAKSHPEVEWINASSGLEIGGYEKRSLSELSLKKKRDLRKELEQMINSINQGALKTMNVASIKNSFVKVGELCSQMLDLLEKIFPNPPEKNGEYALLQMEIEKEEAYQRFIHPIWEVWKYVLARQIPKDIPQEYGLGLNRWLFMKGICDDAKG